jgi:hypothetical protein
VPTTPAPAPTDAGDGENNHDYDDTGDDYSNLPYCDEVGGDYEPVTPTQYTTPATPEESKPTEPGPTTTEEPKPTTTKEPEPTTTEEPKPTTTKEPEPTPTAPDINTGGNNGGNNGSVIEGGFATWYLQEGTTGACGEKHGDNDMIAALHIERYGDVSGHASFSFSRVIDSCVVGFSPL